MAAGEGSSEPDDTKLDYTSSDAPPDPTPATTEDASDEDGDEEDEEEEEEPRLKYANLTRNLSSLYRNGDATSACMVAGDKMACVSSMRPRELMLMYCIDSWNT